MVWFKVLVLIFVFKECFGSYEFDLFGVVGLSARNPPEGVKLVDQGNEPPAFDISQYKGNGLSAKGNQYATLATAFMNSEDISFVSKIRLDNAKRGRYTLFSLLSPTSVLTQYLTAAIQIEGGSSVEGEATGKPVTKLIIFRFASKITDFIILDGKIETGVPFTLALRFQTNSAGGGKRKRRDAEDETFMTVSIDCKEVEKIKLLKPLNSQEYSNIPIGDGMLSVGMLYNDVGSKGAEGIFGGVLGSPRILNGKLAFEMLNPCAKLPNQDVPSEPSQKEYDPTFFEKFVKMTSANVYPVTLFCTDEETNKQYASDTTWYERQDCIKNTCYAGKIVTEILKCATCVVGGKTYYREEVYIDPANPCQRMLCKENRPIKVGRKIRCKSLSCDSFGEVQAEGECCPKCKSDTCTKSNTTYGEGCDKKCTDGSKYECPTKSFGCFCKEGYLLDDKGVCIKDSMCPCKVDSKVYEPNQIVPKSRCSNCICSKGKLNCMSSC